ncbi:hypothetical protein DAI22_07g226900 [Oryza sativa Japonica Group]|uniref:Transcription initiation factor TFIID subunit 9 n=1 Tax=Oryza rufipogon TaxID=4529 RepID=A0A0E0QB57_ORYRU|nr:hypothetical protein DAI22_07g226900 [Oryza sativa Japonica Group]
MDTGADQAPPPPPPPPVAAASAAADEPRDLRVVREILHSLGLREGDYEEAAVHKLLLFAHRYAGDVLGEAKAYAGHAGRESLQADDVRLAIQARGMSSAAPPSREEMLDIAHKCNEIPIPKPCVPSGSISLPHYEDMLLNKKHIFVPRVEPTPHQIEETEDDYNDDGSNANVASPDSNYDQDLFGSISLPHYQDMLLNQNHLSVHRVEPAHDQLEKIKDDGSNDNADSSHSNYVQDSSGSVSLQHHQDMSLNQNHLFVHQVELTLDQIEEIKDDGSNDNVDSANFNCVQDPSRSVSFPHYQVMPLNQNHLSFHQVEPMLDQVEEIKDDGSNDNVASPDSNCIQDPHYQDMLLNQDHLSVRGVEPTLDQVEEIEDDCSSDNVASPDSNYDKEKNDSNKQKPSKKVSQLNTLVAAGKDKVDCSTELS